MERKKVEEMEKRTMADRISRGCTVTCDCSAYGKFEKNNPSQRTVTRRPPGSRRMPPDSLVGAHRTDRMRSLHTKRSWSERLTAILEQVAGVGKVKVMITLKDSGQTVLEKDVQSTENQTSESDDAERQPER